MVIFTTVNGAKRRAAVGRLHLKVLKRKAACLRLCEAGTSAAPVAVRPIDTANDLQAVQGLLRSFTALAMPCALCLWVIKCGDDQAIL